MVTPEEVKKLAALARIEVAEEDLPRFVKEFEAILEYVSQIEKLQLPERNADSAPKLRNVMREDGEPHEGGAFTDKLTEQFPARRDGYLEVKQIISHE